jgi:hypothetical protein
VDLARAAAVLGMVLVHTAPSSVIGARWQFLLSGRSAALFAVVAGVSLALCSGGSIAHRRSGFAPDRWAIAARGLALFVLGLALTQLPSPVPVILCTYGALFWAVLPVLSWGWRSLAVLAAASAVGAPVLSLLARSMLGGHAHLASYRPLTFHLLSSGDAFVASLKELLLFGAFPALTWLPYVLAGMALGRWGVARSSAWAWLLGGGAVLAAAGYGLSHVALHQFGAYTVLARSAGVADVDSYLRGGPPGSWHPFPTEPWQWILTSAPHTGTPFEIIGNIGVALAVIGLALLLARMLPGPLAPLATLGRFALTVYVGHIVALALLDHWGIAMGQWGFLAFVLGSLVAANVWDRYLGRGPLERAQSWVGDRARRLIGA